MVELVSIKNMPYELKVEILKALGFDSDGTYVTKGGNRYDDKYTGDPIKVDNMVILPGSTVVLDDNLLSVSSFLEDYGNVL